MEDMEKKRKRVLASYTNFLVSKGEFDEAKRVARYGQDRQDQYVKRLLPYTQYLFTIIPEYGKTIPFSIKGKSVYLENKEIGKLRNINFKPLPSEMRMRIAYQYLYDRLILFLLEQGFGIIDYDGREYAVVFQPNGLELEQCWRSFFETLNFNDVRDMLNFRTRPVAFIQPFPFGRLGVVIKSFLVVCYARECGIFDEYANKLRAMHIAKLLSCESKNVLSKVDHLYQVKNQQAFLKKIEDKKLKRKFEALFEKKKGLEAIREETERWLRTYLKRRVEEFVECIKKDSIEFLVSLGAEKEQSEKRLSALLNINELPYLWEIIELLLRRKSQDDRRYVLKGYWATQKANMRRTFPFCLEIVDELKGNLLKQPYELDKPYQLPYEGCMDVASDYCYICGEEVGSYSFISKFKAFSPKLKREAQKIETLRTVISIGEYSDFRTQSKFSKKTQPLCFQCYFVSLLNPLHFDKYVTVEFAPSKSKDFLANLSRIETLISSSLLVEMLQIYPVGRFFGIPSPQRSVKSIGIDEHVLYTLSRLERWEEIEEMVRIYWKNGEGTIQKRHLILLSALRGKSVGFAEKSAGEVLCKITDDHPIDAIYYWAKEFYYSRYPNPRFVDKLMKTVRIQYKEVLGGEKMKDEMAYAYLLYLFTNKGKIYKESVKKAILYDIAEANDNISAFLLKSPEVMYESANPDSRMPFLTKCLREVLLEVKNKIGIDVAQERKMETVEGERGYRFNVDTLVAVNQYLYEKHHDRVDEFKNHVRNMFLTLFLGKLRGE